MGNYVLETILVFAGFFLISIFLSEDFQAVVAAPSGYFTSAAPVEIGRLSGGGLAVHGRRGPHPPGLDDLRGSPLFL